MNIAVIGSGGREHSVCFKLKQSKEVNKIFCIPGNAGTSAIAENINIDILNFKSISDFLRKMYFIWFTDSKNQQTFRRR